jgi:hypothetical protein
LPVLAVLPGIGSGKHSDMSFLLSVPGSRGSLLLL